MKKNAVICLIAMIVVCGALLCACDKTPSCPMETDMSVDLTSDVGLYFFGDTYDDYVRYSHEMAGKYFDKTKPTMFYFHGWATQEKQEGEIYAALHTNGPASNAGARYIDYVEEFKQRGYNVCALDYCKYAMNLIKLADYIWASLDGGHSVACRFAKEIADCFQDYDQELRFFGHSYGAHSSVATAYLLYKMRDCGIVDGDCLPKRITLADPYIGDFTLMVDDAFLSATIDNVNEPVGGRTQTQVFADAIEYLHGKGVVIDAYCAMPLAFDTYMTDDEEKHNELKAKLHRNGVWTVLEGCQEAFGTVGDIHVIAEDWMFHSYFAPVKTYGDGFMPTAALSNEEMAKLIGRTYKSTYVGFDVENDMLVETFDDESVQ